MRKLVAVLLLVATQGLFAARQSSDFDSVRFETVDVFVDAHGQPLAAYQLEFFATTGDVKIAGIEGGADRAFAEPPYYDPKAMQHERVILGAFSTDEAAELPRDKARVATIHVQVRGARQPEFRIRLQTAADPRGASMMAEATFEKRDTP